MKDLRKRTFSVSGLSFLVYSLSSIAISICLVNIKRDLNFSLTEAGLFGMLCAIEQMIILFISPIFAAKFGKIKVLRTALLILTAGLFFFSKSINFFTALLSALCMGLGVANMEAYKVFHALERFGADVMFQALGVDHRGFFTHTDFQ